MTQPAVAGVTTAAVQRAVARLLGTDTPGAQAAVGAAAAAGVVGHGIALLALVVAARRGTDATGALALMAAGEPPPRSWSEYELRAAVAEGAEEAAAALRGLGRAAARPGAAVVTLTGEETPARAVDALRAGVRGLVVAPADGMEGAGRIDARWVAGLAAAVGVPVADDAPLRTSGTRGGTAPPLARLAPYLDPFEAHWPAAPPHADR